MEKEKNTTELELPFLMEKELHESTSPSTVTFIQEQFKHHNYCSVCRYIEIERERKKIRTEHFYSSNPLKGIHLSLSLSLAGYALEEREREREREKRGTKKQGGTRSERL